MASRKKTDDEFELEEKPFNNMFDLGSWASYAFAKSGPGSNWVTCRETFHRYVMRRQTKGFFFHVGKATCGQVARFIHEMERRLKLPEQSRFYKTTNQKVTYIEVSPFWRQQAMRRQLFTVLLRCGRYYMSDFLKAIQKDVYGKQTYKAIRHFMKGYTDLASCRGGWVNCFFEKRYDPKTRKQLTEEDYAKRILGKMKKPKVAKSKPETPRRQAA